MKKPVLIMHSSIMLSLIETDIERKEERKEAVHETISSK
jgi:hypothetical protein